VADQPVLKIKTAVLAGLTSVADPEVIKKLKARTLQLQQRVNDLENADLSTSMQLAQRIKELEDEYDALEKEHEQKPLVRVVDTPVTKPLTLTPELQAHINQSNAPKPATGGPQPSHPSLSSTCDYVNHLKDPNVDPRTLVRRFVTGKPPDESDILFGLLEEAAAQIGDGDIDDNRRTGRSLSEIVKYWSETPPREKPAIGEEDAETNFLRARLKYLQEANREADRILGL
jgi:hypothetical protein